MIAVGLAALGFFLVAGWSVTSLRSRLQLLQELRRLHREVYALRDEFEDRLDDLEDACRVAAFGPPEGGMRASDAAERLVELREALFRADEELAAFEIEWTRGSFEAARDKVMAALHRVDLALGSVRLLGTQVERQGERFATGAGIEGLQNRAHESRKRVQRAASDPGVRSQVTACADRLAGHLDQALAECLGLQGSDAGPRERAERAKRVAWALSRLERFGEKLARVDAIADLVHEHLPRVLSEAHDALDPAGDRLGSQLAAVEASGREARAALEDGDLVRADTLARRAIGAAKRLARWFPVGILDAPTWGGSGVMGLVLSLLEAARLPPVGTLAAVGVALVLAVGVGGAIGQRIGGSAEILVSPGNLALGRPALSSGELDPAHAAAKAFDGDPSTAWESGASLEDPQWLVVDLGRSDPVNEVMVLPLAAPASLCSWAADVSAGDGIWHALGQASSWGDVRSPRWGKLLAPAGTQARLVRIRPLDWGKSGVAILEVRVFAPPRASQ